MALALGTKLGPYDIVALLGAGGMGEVYRATDSRLGRDVALKVLPEAFARDAQRMARFEREAKFLASLNHPNIASIYGLEESDGTRALVMELVEGQTLGERIKNGALALDEALPVGKQIAEGLEYAHERGIIHRDLKPSNVKLTPDGQVKLLDFGLAKALDGDTADEELQNSPTLSAAATRAGALLGTAAYMSPEQARGKRVDRRADIWAFGCVLYEMLTGRRAFSGETTSDILASVIRAEPDWSFLPASVPARIHELLRRCLQKDPKQRLQAIGDARITIQETLSGSPISEGVAGVMIPRAARRVMLWAVLTVGLLVGAISTGFIALTLRRTPTAGPVGRFAFTFPSPGEAAAAAGMPLSDFPAVAISPDGTEIAYVAGHAQTTQIFLRLLDRLEPQPLAGTANATSPFFSPDGQWVGFFADGKLKKVSIHGGDPTTLCDTAINRNGAWGPDNAIIFAPALFSGLMRVSAAGGSPEVLTTPDFSKGEISHRWPEILPGGRAVVFVIAGAKDIGFFSESKIAVERLDTHERKILPIQGSFPRYSPTGHLLFVSEGRVFAVGFDLNRLEVTGKPTPVLDGVKTSPNSGAADYVVSKTGSLAYLSENASASGGNLVWEDRKGQVKELPAPARIYVSPQISPDGQRVAVSIFSGGSLFRADIWLYEISHGTLTRLTFDEQSAEPVWSPDGKQIAFARMRGAKPGILLKAADGSGTAETLVSGDNFIQTPTSWSLDGKFLTYWEVGAETGADIWILPLQGERKPWPFLQTKFNEGEAKFSPDGRWVAYSSDESGRPEVYVRPFPGPGAKWQISTDGGGAPEWARNGRELFYVSLAGKLVSVVVRTQPAFSADIPRIIADIPSFLLATFGPGYSVSSDGQRFLFVKANVEKGPPDEVRVVLNWTEELKELMTRGKRP
jgi:Tol biopolymer transport system component